MVAKINNTHKYPDANRQPRHLANLRRETAKTNKQAYDKLSTQQKLDLINEKFPTGASEQRARLTSLLEKEKQVQSEAPAQNNKSHKKK